MKNTNAALLAPVLTSLTVTELSASVSSCNGRIKYS